jgi:tetratricopeptide (TPR) repeat protein
MTKQIPCTDRKQTGTIQSLLSDFRISLRSVQLRPQGPRRRACLYAIEAGTEAVLRGRSLRTATGAHGLQAGPTSKRTHLGESIEHLAVAHHLYRGYRDYDGARVQLAIAKRGLPNSVEAINYEAFIDRRQGNMEKAIEGLTEALALDPRSLTPLYFLSQTLYVIRTFDLAAPLYDRIIDLYPNRPAYKVVKAVYTQFYKTGYWRCLGGNRIASTIGCRGSRCS